MPTITNPAPITAAVFNAYWITRLLYTQTPGKPALLLATLAPFDGQHLLASSIKSYMTTDIDDVAKTDSALATELAALRAEVARQAIPPAGAVLQLIQVDAPDPGLPVRGQIVYRGSDGKIVTPTYAIPDCFALAARDTQFGSVFQTMLATVARLAGLSIS